MDAACISCPHLCKRLSNDDEALVYGFSRLSPKEVIALTEIVISKRVWRRLLLNSIARVGSGQIAILYQPSEQYTAVADQYEESNIIEVVTLTRRMHQGTQLCFTYRTPGQWCPQHELMSELTKAIQEVLGCLSYCDQFKTRGRKRLLTAVGDVAFRAICFHDWAEDRQSN